MALMKRANAKLERSWQQRLCGEFEKDYMQKLGAFLAEEYKKGKKIFPAGDQYFAALNKVAFEEVRVVILGQDPYHGAGQAHGLSFSVPAGVPVPPSLLNIYKELETDLGIKRVAHGTLEAWAAQGVLLLNSVLTVEEGQAASHQGKGWELFTDAVIHRLNVEREGLVFVLWGSYAQKKGSFIDRNKHFVLESPHPSPLSAHRGFLGSKPFSKINHYLESKSLKPIQWDLSGWDLKH
jgi:uracil-DNA glycosylase